MPASTLPRNSTNVRNSKKRHLPPENTTRVIAVAIAFFGTFALLGWNAGVFAKLDTGEQALLAGFAVGFAVLTYLVDGQVRRAVDSTALALRGWFNARERRSPPRVT